jgi:hypothetical protein
MMKKEKSLTNELKVIVVNPPSKEEAKKKIQQITDLLIMKGCK